VSAAFTGFSVCLYGIDAEKISLHRDEAHNALYLELSDDVHIRLDLNRLNTLSIERAAEVGRDRDGVLRLAEVAAQAAREIGQLAGDGEGPPAEPAEDSGRLDRIRVVLARFDWEHDDRQLALEAIERIADGGQA
jgi:hypothetical protein